VIPPPRGVSRPVFRISSLSPSAAGAPRLNCGHVRYGHDEEKTMTYRSAPLPSSSAVAGVVTMVACTWFLMATGMILTDTHSERLVEAGRAALAEQAVVPDDRVTIVVEARRDAASL
jgi:hypothetical protein